MKKKERRRQKELFKDGQLVSNRTRWRRIELVSWSGAACCVALVIEMTRKKEARKKVLVDVCCKN